MTIGKSPDIIQHENMDQRHIVVAEDALNRCNASL